MNCQRCNKETIESKEYCSEYCYDEYNEEMDELVWWNFRGLGAMKCQKCSHLLEQHLLNSEYPEKQSFKVKWWAK